MTEKRSPDAADQRPSVDSRAVLHPDGADLFQTLLAKVAALGEQIHPASLEVLKLVKVQLQKCFLNKSRNLISAQIKKILFFLKEKNRTFWLRSPKAEWLPMLP